AAGTAEIDPGRAQCIAVHWRMSQRNRRACTIEYCAAHKGVRHHVSAPTAQLRALSSAADWFYSTPRVIYQGWKWRNRLHCRLPGFVAFIGINGCQRGE